jgi:hypothetical protein
LRRSATARARCAAPPPAPTRAVQAGRQKKCKYSVVCGRQQSANPQTNTETRQLAGVEVCVCQPVGWTTDHAHACKRRACTGAVSMADCWRKQVNQPKTTRSITRRAAQQKAASGDDAASRHGRREIKQLLLVSRRRYTQNAESPGILIRMDIFDAARVYRCSHPYIVAFTCLQFFLRWQPLSDHDMPALQRAPLIKCSTLIPKRTLAPAGGRPRPRLADVAPRAQASAGSSGAAAPPPSVAPASPAFLLEPDLAPEAATSSEKAPFNWYKQW